MILQKKYRIILAVTLTYAMLLLLTCNYFHPVSLQSGHSEQPRPLTWKMSQPLHASSLFTDKVQPFSVNDINRRSMLSRIFPVCLDDKITNRIIDFNISIYQIIQMRTSPAFNCRLQI